MERNYYIGDFEFESRVFSIESELTQSKVDKSRKLCEFIFFLANDSQDSFLISKNTYPKNYLDKLNELGFFGNYTNDQIEGEFWVTPDIPLEYQRTFNSKYFSSNLEKKLFDFNCTYEINNQKELNSFIKKYKGKRLLKKQPFSFGGIGHEILTLEQLSHNLFPLFLEDYHCRQTDFSIKVINNEVYYLYQYINQRGQFLGFGIDEKIPIEVLEPIYRSVEAELNKTYDIANQEWNIDLYSFTEDNQVKLRPLCEINFRRSMTSPITNLIKRVSKGDVGEFFFSSNLKGLELNTQDKVEVLELSPPNHPFKCLWLTGPRQFVEEYKQDQFPKHFHDQVKCPIFNSFS